MSFTLTGQRIAVIRKHCGLSLLMAAFLSETIDLKTDNLDRVSIPRKSWPLLMSNYRFMGKLMVPNDEPKSVNIDKISTALHVYYLNLIVNYLNTVQIAQIQAYNFECTPCSDAINGAMNRVFDIKSGHDFCR